MTVEMMVVRQRGQPAKPNERGRVVSIRLSPLDLERAKAAAKINHTTFSGFIRESLVSASLECMEPMPDEDRL